MPSTRCAHNESTNLGFARPHFDLGFEKNVYQTPACVASVSVWFPSKKDRGRRFSVLTAREIKREPKIENRTETPAKQAIQSLELTTASRKPPSVKIEYIFIFCS